MIPRNFITEWKKNAPWQDNAQVEQDLILSRAIVEIYSSELLRNSLIFRGGTALHKLYSPLQERYSEDLDFVQKRPEPIGKTLKELHQVINPWLGYPKWKQTRGRVTLYYRFDSEISPVRSMKVKIEINTREHFKYNEFVQVPFSVSSRWFDGKAFVPTYTLEELLGTKMRALYQKKKGRDLFDLNSILTQFPDLNKKEVVECFLFYLEKEGLSVSRREFKKNMELKLKDNLFLQDIIPLLQVNKKYDPKIAYRLVQETLIEML